jgi:hypothetical protein
MSNGEMTLLAYEVLIEDPSKYEDYKKYINIENIENLLMFRPEFISKIDVLEISRHSWNLILNEQPQLINIYLKCLNIKVRSPQTRTKILNKLYKTHLDLKYYL